MEIDKISRQFGLMGLEPVLKIFEEALVKDNVPPILAVRLLTSVIGARNRGIPLEALLAIAWEKDDKRNETG